MKTLSRAVGVVVVASVCFIALLGWRAHAQSGSSKFELNFPQPKPLKAGRDASAHFKKVLDDHHAVYYCMTHRNKEGKETPLKKNCPDSTSVSSTENPESTSEVMPACGAHVTQKAGFSTAEDMSAVASEFQ